MNDFYILLAQFFSTCLLQYFYICLGKIKQIKNSNAYENIDLEFVLKCLEKSLKEYLYKCHRYHCFCRFRQEFVINSEPSIVFQP